MGRRSIRRYGRLGSWILAAGAVAPASASPVLDLGAFSALPPLISPSGEIVAAVNQQGGGAPVLHRWASPSADMQVLATPEWFEPTRMGLSPGGTLVLSAWDTRGAWQERPYLYPVGGELAELPYAGKFPSGVSVPVLTMDSAGAVFGFGRLEEGDQPIAFARPDQPAQPVPTALAGSRIESVLVGQDDALVLSVSPEGTQAPRTMRFDGERWHDLGDPSEGGEDGWLLARACGPGGVMVGAGAGSLSAPGEPVVVQPDGAIESLGLLEGWISGEANAANASGWIVGSATIYDEQIFDLRTQAFVWHESAGLVELTDPAGEWTFLSASGISDGGWVVGIGLHDGLERAYAMRIPAPGTLLVLGGAMAVRRRRV